MKTLRDYANSHCITYKTAWNRFKADKIPNAFKDVNGRVLIDETKSIDYNQAILYCRVSSNKQKDDLERQVERVKDFAISNGYVINRVIKEIGSGVNDQRRGLIKLLNDENWNTLIVEHSDRLTRFGFNYLKVLLERLNKKIIVINQTEGEKEDLMTDMISVLYSFSARMYGRRRSSKIKAKKALEDMK